MKSLYACTFLFLIGCGHATTKMDRELALKLADKAPVIVQSAPPIINVNNYNGGQPVSVSPSSETMSADELTLAQSNQENCTNTPVYNYAGQLVRTVRRCFGGK